MHLSVRGLAASENTEWNGIEHDRHLDGGGRRCRSPLTPVIQTTGAVRETNSQPTSWSAAGGAWDMWDVTLPLEQSGVCPLQRTLARRNVEIHSTSVMSATKRVINRFTRLINWQRKHAHIKTDGWTVM